MENRRKEFEFRNNIIKKELRLLDIYLHGRNLSLKEDILEDDGSFSVEKTRDLIDRIVKHYYASIKLEHFEKSPEGTISALKKVEEKKAAYAKAKLMLILSFMYDQYESGDFKDNDMVYQSIPEMTNHFAVLPLDAGDLRPAEIDLSMYIENAVDDGRLKTFPELNVWEDSLIVASVEDDFSELEEIEKDFGPLIYMDKWREVSGEKGMSPAEYAEDFVYGGFEEGEKKFVPKDLKKEIKDDFSKEIEETVDRFLFNEKSPVICDEEEFAEAIRPLDKALSKIRSYVRSADAEKEKRK